MTKRRFIEEIENRGFIKEVDAEIWKNAAGKEIIMMDILNATEVFGNQLFDDLLAAIDGKITSVEDLFDT